MSLNLKSSKKAQILMEALPYIKKYHGRTMVIKYGGKAMVAPKLQESVMTDIALLKLVGINIVLLHGGGPQITEHLKRLSIKTKFKNGLRVTDEETMEVVRMVMVGKINKELVSILNAQGLRAIGLSGEDANLLQAEPVDRELGFVGNVSNVNSKMLKSLLEEGYLPVIAGVAGGKDGKPYNINADMAASKVAAALKADKLIFLTDVDGVLIKEGGKESLATVLAAAQCKNIAGKEEIKGGMRPKLESSYFAVSNGVKRAHILNGTLRHALLLEIFTDEGIGTMVLPDREVV